MDGYYFIRAGTYIKVVLPMSSEERKPCLYALHNYCIVFNNLLKSGKFKKEELGKKWGTEDWIKLHCAMCVKSMYARAKWKTVKGYSVVNTL